MQKTARPNTRKRAINVTVDDSLLAEAKAAGVNVSALTEAALRAALRAHREASWREQNRKAIVESNLELEQNGLWYDAYRTW